MQNLTSKEHSHAAGFGTASTLPTDFPITPSDFCSNAGHAPRLSSWHSSYECNKGQQRRQEKGSLVTGWVWSQEGAAVALPGIMKSAKREIQPDHKKRMSLISPSSAAIRHPTQQRGRMSKVSSQPRHPTKTIGPDQESNPRFDHIVQDYGFSLWLCTGNNTSLYSGWPLRAYVLLRLLFYVTNTKPTVSEITCWAYF